ncbi:hypothetical protein [Dactylosporangium sp. CA-233914]|uniref:hypothetical protein n=1 Tax=Dactylosporangium sp. CA-233914 TaxID=3239934 RepID=UPI003D9005C0
MNEAKRSATSTVVRSTHTTANICAAAITALTLLGGIPGLHQAALMGIGVIGALGTAAMGVGLAAVKQRR